MNVKTKGLKGAQGENGGKGGNGKAGAVSMLVIITVIIILFSQRRKSSFHKAILCIRRDNEASYLVNCTSVHI